jgi:hypothetical protein
MTSMIEERQLIGFEDIAAVQYECLRCHAKQVFPLDDVIRVPGKCVNCGEDWDYAQKSHGDDRFAYLLRHFREIREVLKTLERFAKLKVSLEIVFEEEDEK